VYINPVGVLASLSVFSVGLSATTDELLVGVVFRCTFRRVIGAEILEEIVVRVKVRLVVHREVWEHLLVTELAG